MTIKKEINTLDPFEEESKKLQETLKKKVQEANLPKPVNNPQVLNEIRRLTPDSFNKIASGEIEAPSPLHKQAILYVKALNNSRETSKNEIIPHVYVGNLDSYEELEKGDNPLQFTRVISLTRIGRTAEIPDKVDRIKLSIDNETAWNELQGCFEELFSTIDLARKEKKNLLIHCLLGESRSVSLMISYLINRFHLSYEEALTYVKTKRFAAQPSPLLEAGLKIYSEKIKVNER